MKRRIWWSITKWSFLGGLLLLAALLGLLAVWNAGLPTASPVMERLSAAEQARLGEATHLRKTLGGRVWPGWDELEIPLVVYNEAYAFLTGASDPAPGWIRVPHERVEGEEWQPVPGADHFRQPLPDSGSTPQAFIVRIGATFAASMTTHDWTRIRMVDTLRSRLPGILAPFFPYGLVLGKFDSEWHITAVLHESFHVLQARQAYTRLEEAEAATRLEGDYPWEDTAFRGTWIEERRLLAAALRTDDGDALRTRVGRWVGHRADRRKGLPAELVAYERRREWLEGLAKYAEVRCRLLAGMTEGYRPHPAMAGVDGFDGYREAESHWEHEVDQLARDWQFDETIFYYSGWAQAELLDRLMPGWKDEAMRPAVFLDDLLAKACGG